MPVIAAAAAAAVIAMPATGNRQVATTNNDTLEGKLLNYDNQETRHCKQLAHNRNDDR